MLMENESGIYAMSMPDLLGHRAGSVSEALR